MGIKTSSPIGSLPTWVLAQLSSLISVNPDFSAGLPDPLVLDFPGVANPTPPAAGHALLHARTPASGVTRLEVDNQFTPNVILGRDTVFVVRNATGQTIPRFALVYVSGADGAIPTVGLADATDAARMPAIGTVLADILDGELGQVMRIGIVEDLDLSMFSNGEMLYVDPANPGGGTPTRPVPPNIVQAVAIVLSNSATVGAALAIFAPALLGNETGTSAATFELTSAVDMTGTGPSVDFASNEVTVSSKGTIQIPFAINAISGVSVNLQEWRVDNSVKAFITPTGGLKLTLPTQNPGPGILWNDGNTVKVGT